MVQAPLAEFPLFKKTISDETLNTGMHNVVRENFAKPYGAMSAPLLEN